MGDDWGDWGNPPAPQQKSGSQKPAEPPNTDTDDWGDWGSTSAPQQSTSRSQRAVKPQEASASGWGDWGSTSTPQQNRSRNQRAVESQRNDTSGWGDWGSTSTSQQNRGRSQGAVEPQKTDSSGWGDWNSSGPAKGSTETKKSNDSGWGGGGDNSSWGGGGSGSGSGGWDDKPAQRSDRPRRFDDTRNRDRPPRPPRGESTNHDGFQKITDGEGGEGGGDKEPPPPPFKPEEVNLEEEAKLHADGVGENFKRYREQQVSCLPLGAVEPVEKFQDVIESELLLKNVASKNFTEMTPIQKWAMPAIMKGFDIISCAQTGSGKTAAFLLPILQTILKTDLDPQDPNEDCRNPYCLILLPTRELARQIYTEAMFLSRDSIVRVCYIYGQVATAHLKAQLSRGCHVLVSTLGRLKDFVERRWIGFKNIKYIVLDEGDRLIDDGFKGDIATIFGHETMPPKEQRQTLFFSATFKKDMQAQAINYLNDEKFVFLAVGKIGASNEDIKQEFLQVARAEKKRELKKILAEVPESDKAIIFTQTKASADILAGFFSSLGLPACSIHGDRHQHQREQAIQVFKKGERRFLISSPVGNRGLDLPKVSLVINYDLPDNIDEYVHRIGRTGRAGHTGRAISFVDLERDREVIPDLLKNLKDAKQEIPDWLTEDGAALGTGGDCFNGTASDDWGASASTNPSTSATTNDNWSNAGTGSEDWGNAATVSSKPTGAKANDDWCNSGTANDDWGNATKVAPSANAASKAGATDDDDWGNLAATGPSVTTTSGGQGSARNDNQSSQDEEWGATSSRPSTSKEGEDLNGVSTSLKRPADDQSSNPAKKVDTKPTSKSEWDEW